MTKTPKDLNATDWIKVGDSVRCLGGEYERKPGFRVVGEGHPDTAWLLVGAVGKVLKVSPGYPRHRCPDHHKDPDCICGGDEFGNGWVDVMSSWATVEYETDKPRRTIKRAIQCDEEGDDWERVSPKR
jgi:hypothetical protein